MGLDRYKRNMGRKDLINEAGVDPNQLKTWDGYITAVRN